MTIIMPYAFKCYILFVVFWRRRKIDLSLKDVVITQDVQNLNSWASTAMERCDMLWRRWVRTRCCSPRCSTLSTRPRTASSFSFGRPNSRPWIQSERILLDLLWIYHVYQSIFCKICSSSKMSFSLSPSQFVKSYKTVCPNQLDSITKNMSSCNIAKHKLGFTKHQK